MSQVEQRSELEAVDLALRGEAVAPEHEQLAELAIALRSLRPRPSAQFTAKLDERAAGGFRREKDRRAASRAGRTRWIPAGAAALAVAAAATVVAISSTSRSRAPSSPGSAVLVGTGPRVAGGQSGSPGATVTAGSASVKGTAAPAPSAAPGTQAGAEGAPARQIERSSTLDVGVPSADVQSAAQRVFGIAASFGGYVTQSNVSSGSVGQSYASFQLRLPSARLASAIAALSHLGHVRSETDSTNDVTGEYDSLTRSLGDALAERSSLLRQIAATSEPAALARLRERLRIVEHRIGSLEGSLHALSQRVNLTPLALSLTAEASAGAGSGSTSLTPGDALHAAGRILSAAVAVLVIALAAALPLVLVLLAAAVALERTRRMRRERALDAR